MNWKKLTCKSWPPGTPACNDFFPHSQPNFSFLLAKKWQRVPSRAKAIHTRFDSHLMCFIILLMQFNQNTVTRYEYKISLLLPALLSFESLENNFSWLRRMTKIQTRGNGRAGRRKNIIADIFLQHKYEWSLEHAENEDFLCVPWTDMRLCATGIWWQ